MNDGVSAPRSSIPLSMFCGEMSDLNGSPVLDNPGMLHYRLQYDVLRMGREVNQVSAQHSHFVMCYKFTNC